MNMPSDIRFKYSPEYENNASFEEPPCDCTGGAGELSFLCLSGVYFDDPDAPEAVCLNDLVTGRVRVYIDDWVTRQLEQSVKKTHPDWTDTQLQSHVDQAVDELSRTPPVPWIQNNLWPSCHGDFCRYLGEWDQEKLTQASPDGNGQAYLMSIIQDPEGLGYPDQLWRSIGDNWARIYVFQCLVCERLIAIDQSF
jgi:uncharacterized protein CbrC (UPF0167 family)